MVNKMKHCKCTLRQEALGDGCSLCNTEYWISTLPTPEELQVELMDSFSDDQAYYIASDVYQPLLGLIETLNTKIKNIEIKLDNKGE